MEIISKPLIMIVDDESVNLKYMGEMLGREFDLLTFISGIDALEFFKTDNRMPDLILLDIIMPNMDGYEVCIELKENSDTRHIPVIFMTALSDELDEEKGFLVGASDYIKKPFSRITAKARIVNQLNLKKYQDLLVETSFLDPLTDIPNRRYFDVNAAREFSILKRYRGNISCLMIDIDNFKLYNDNYGHVAGDDCLKLVAQAINSYLVRKNDFCARYGGEEFVILLPGTDKSGAKKVADAVLKVVSNLMIRHDFSFVSHYVTVSIGCASVGYNEIDDEQGLVELADKALYLAKKLGKNRVECDSAEHEPVKTVLSMPVVSEIATKNIIVLESTATIKEAVDTITTKSIRNLIVHDTNDGQYHILSVSDVVFFANDTSKLELPVSTLELKILPICSKDMNILEVFMLFGKNTAIVGIVNEENVLDGVITYSNMLNAVYGFDDDSLAKPVNSLLHSDTVHRIHSGVILSECLDGLYALDTDCMIVLDDMDKPMGIITKRDIAKFLSKGIDLQQPVEMLMNTPIVSVGDDFSINMALYTMQESKLKRIIVVDKQGRLCGAVSQKELLDTVYSKLTQKGFFSLEHLNQILIEQVERRTFELKQLNRNLENRVKLATEEIRQRDNKIAERKKNDMILELLINVAHHWRQPLNMLGLSVQDVVLQKRFEELDEQSLEVFKDDSMAIIKGLSKSIDNFLGLFRGNNTKSRFCIEETILETVNVVSYQFEKELVNIEIDMSTKHYYTGYANEFRQVMISILLNSRDMILLNSNKSEQKQITILVVCREDSICIETASTCGIVHTEQIDRLFKPQLILGDEAQCIGLFISKEIVGRYLDGELIAKPSDDGMVFTVILPK